MYPNSYIRPSLLSKGASFAKGINWSGILDGTQKTLGVINQAIPIVYQVKPMITNAKTMFKIADEVRSSDKVQSSSNVVNTNNYTDNTPQSNNERPIFYI